MIAKFKVGDMARYMPLTPPNNTLTPHNRYEVKRLSRLGHFITLTNDRGRDIAYNASNFELAAISLTSVPNPVAAATPSGVYGGDNIKLDFKQGDKVAYRDGTKIKLNDGYFIVDRVAGKTLWFNECATVAFNADEFKRID